MFNNQPLVATLRQDGRHRAQMMPIDLLLQDGTFLPLEATSTSVRQSIYTANSTVLELQVANVGDVLALIAGWPRPLRDGRLIVHEVAPDEVVQAHARVVTPLRDNAEIVAVNPWITIEGPAQAVRTLITSRLGGESLVVAGDALLPPGTKLVSEPDQVVFATKSTPAEAAIT